jgi:hypothetical protein
LTPTRQDARFPNFQPTPSSFPHRLIWSILALLILTAAWGLHLWPTAAHMMARCPLKTFTGIPCFMCGSTRAVHALTHGYFKEASVLNPLGALIGISAGVFIVYSVFTRLTKRPALPDFMARPRFLRGLFILIVLLAFLNWIYLVSAGR